MSGRLVRSTLSLLLAAALGLLVLTGLMLAFERSLIYFPARAALARPADFGMASEELRLESDGARIHGLWLPKDGARRAVLVCNGNAGNASYRLERARLIQQRLDASVLLFDYRGFGESTGRPDERGTYADARAAYEFLVTQAGRAPRQVVLFGESLGAAVAVQLALEREAAALVLEAPFASIPAMARAAYPFLPPVGPLIRTRYDSLSKAPRLRLPLLVLHGEHDQVVPLAQGRRVFEAAPGPKRFHEIAGAGHNDAYVRGGDAYWRVIAEFLDGLPASPSPRP